MPYHRVKRKSIVFLKNKSTKNFFLNILCKFFDCADSRNTKFHKIHKMVRMINVPPFFSDVIVLSKTGTVRLICWRNLHVKIMVKIRHFHFNYFLNSHQLSVRTRLTFFCKCSRTFCTLFFHDSNSVGPVTVGLNIL